jgi:hypothetical protein
MDRVSHAARPFAGSDRDLDLDLKLADERLATPPFTSGPRS